MEPSPTEIELRTSSYPTLAKAMLERALEEQACFPGISLGEVVALQVVEEDAAQRRAFYAAALAQDDPARDPVTPPPPGPSKKRKKRSHAKRARERKEAARALSRGVQPVQAGSPGPDQNQASDVSSPILETAAQREESIQRSKVVRDALTREIHASFGKCTVNCSLPVSKSKYFLSILNPEAEAKEALLARVGSAPVPHSGPPSVLSDENGHQVSLWFQSESTACDSNGETVPLLFFVMAV